MQNSGSHKIRSLLKWCGVVCGAIVLLPLVLVLVFSAYAVPSHNATMDRFERSFANISHPPDATLIGHHTHFGYGPFVMGDGDDICHYYVAEIRSAPDLFEPITQYYESRAHFFGEFSDVEVQVVPIDDTYLALHLDAPTTGWVEEYLLGENSKNAYMVYVKKVDEENVAGDYRCWRD